MDAGTRASRFKQARANIDETVREVQESTLIPKSTISKMESEKSDTNIGYKDIVTLADHYGVNVAWLMGQSDSYSLDVDSQNVTRATGLSTKAVDVLQQIKGTALIDTLNCLLENNGLLQMLKQFDHARRINAESTQTEGQAELIEGLQEIGISNGMESRNSRLSDRQLIDMYLWRASEVIGSTFRQILKGEKENGKCNKAD